MHYIITALGCKVNQYEAQAIETLLHAHGFTAAADGEPVDLIVVNTCAVTAEGGRKSRQMIRKLREEHPQALCAVCGCWSQLSPEDAASIGADVVHGSGSKQAFVDDILRAFREHAPVTCVDNPFQRFDFEPLPAGAAYGRTRAMLKIQDGCNHRCTYCIVWKARGPERSVPVESVLEQVREAQEAGVPEVVLTGVNLGAYDGKSATDEHVEIDELLEAIMERTTIAHVRISSVEPMDISERLLKVMARYPQRIAPFLHLPVQSGCTATLHRMGRPYSAEAFEDTVRMIRANLPQASLSCDVIVGFPGETDEEFEESLALCRRVGFSRMHVFRYSKRPGTLAADMPDQVPPEVMAERSRRMRDTAQELAIADARRRVGTVERAVLEYGDNLTLGSFHHARLDDTCGHTAPCLLDVAIIGVDDSGLVHARREVHGSLED